MEFTTDVWVGPTAGGQLAVETTQFFDRDDAVVFVLVPPSVQREGFVVVTVPSAPEGQRSLAGGERSAATGQGRPKIVSCPGRGTGCSSMHLMTMHFVKT